MLAFPLLQSNIIAIKILAHGELHPILPLAVNVLRKSQQHKSHSTYPCISASLSMTVTILANKTDQIHKSLLLTIT